MHNKDKYPEIFAAMEKARVREQELLEKRGQYTDQINALQPEIDALNARKQELNALAMADADELREVRAEISRMAKAMGGKTLG